MLSIRVILIMLFSAAVTIISLLGFSYNSNCDQIIGKWRPPDSDVIEMPIVQDSQPHKAYHQFYVPDEQRGLEYRQYLSPSVKVRASGAEGSGTIIYYDYVTGWSYVASCGHLWRGNSSFEETRRRPPSAKIITWYHNNQKLNETKEYEAEVLFWSNNRGYDSSCLRFKSDWEPNHFPIAPLDYKFSSGMRLHSLGCDGGREVAHYDVEFVEFRGNDLITRRNSPRPGRSGGGLLSDDGYYVGTCWGTSDTRSGGGVGYFTPLKSIHKVYVENGHQWLLEVGIGTFAQQIPIYDWLNPYAQFDRQYIPVPSRNRIIIPKYGEDYYPNK